MLSRYCNGTFLTASLLCVPALVNAPRPACAQTQRGLLPPRTVTASVQVNTIGGTPKASVEINWSQSRNAKTYIVYRNGSQLAAGITSQSFIDNTVGEGQTYAYAVASADNRSQSAKSQSVSVTIPVLSQQQGPAPASPLNLRAKGIWNGSSTTMLAWNPAPGAVKYRIYQYDIVVGETTSTNYTVPNNRWVDGLTFTVTSIRADGKESIPSNVVMSIGGPDPARPPAWTPSAPQAPSRVTIVPEWNNGAARNRIYWKGFRDDWTYNVYRDGNLIATGLWQLQYIDEGVTPNQSYVYTVTGCNYNWTTLRESAPSAPVTGRAMSAPMASSSLPITVTGIAPNDDSAIVSFTGVPGAVDYRISSPANPGTWKYSGGSLGVEVNGLIPGVAKTFIVEALDKLGPYQKIDGDLGPGGSHSDGTVVQHINGQGDPSNVPNVLAKSAPFPVAAQPRTLTGSQAFFDTFRSFAPLQQVPVDPLIAATNGPDRGDNPNNRYVREWQNNRWIIRNYMGDMNMSRNFVMSNHFMDTLYDGGTSYVSWPLHNNDATLAMVPKATADFSGGRVLHVTFEVDAHFSGRRWTDVIVADADEPLIKPNDIFFRSMPTPSGKIFRWDQFAERSIVVVGQGRGGDGKMNQASLSVEGGGGFPRRMGWDGNPFLNGTTQDLDKRHRFDLYLSQTRFRIVEQGVVMADGPLPAPLAFPLNRVAVYFLHQVYHTSLERADNITYSPDEVYWTNHRPFADERHWDNMGFEVLNNFPG